MAAEVAILTRFVTVVGEGIKLSISLYDFASTLGHAGDEIKDLGCEVTSFCAVMRQVRSTLTKAKSFRVSLTAIQDVEDVLNRGNDIFDKIKALLSKLQGEDKSSVDIFARVRWAFKKSKVLMWKEGLRSCTAMIHVMLSTMDLAQRLATTGMFTSTSDVENEQLREMLQSLLLAQQSTTTRLERLEEQTILEALETANADVGRPPHSSDASGQASTQLRRPDHRRNLSSRAIFDIKEDIGVPRDRSQRTSVVLNSKIFLGQDLRESQRRTLSSISDRHLSITQTNMLLNNWIDQSDPPVPYCLSFPEDYYSNTSAYKSIWQSSEVHIDPSAQGSYEDFCAPSPREHSDSSEIIVFDCERALSLTLNLQDCGSVINVVALALQNFEYMDSPQSFCLWTREQQGDTTANFCRELTDSMLAEIRYELPRSDFALFILKLTVAGPPTLAELRAATSCAGSAVAMQDTAEVAEDEYVFKEQAEILARAETGSKRETDEIDEVAGTEQDGGKFESAAKGDTWYLQLECSQEVSYDTSVQPPRLKSGTLPGLVEQLTRHDRLDAQFNATFLLTYRSFTSAEELLILLIRRFNICPPTGLTMEQYSDWENRKQKLVRLRVINILKTWLEYYWMEEPSKQTQMLLERAHTFTKTSMTSIKTPGSRPLMGVIDQRLKGQDIHTTNLLLTLTPLAPVPILPPNMKKLRFLDIDPTEFARQLTIVESILYGKIMPIECLDKAWQKKPEDSSGKRQAPNVISLIHHSNQLTNWVAEMILGQAEVKKRAVVIKHFVAMAEKCRALNNFSTLTSIVSAFGTAPILRLNRTWASVSPKTSALLESMRQLMASSKNFGCYREKLHAAPPPCIPFLGVYLTDLKFIENGNTSVVKNTDLINFTKQAMTAEVIRDLQQYQKVPYSLTPVPDLQEWILENMKRASDVHEMYNKSLQVEPREMEDDKIARLLSQSGFM